MKRRASRNCLNCDEDIREGRKDKIFCSTSCKNEFHNNHNRDPLSPELQINKILHKNRKILQGYISRVPQVHDDVTRDMLVKDGYIYALFTSESINPCSGNKIRWAYDHGLEFNPDRQFYEVRQLDEEGFICF